ncbi:MAG: HAMP domain-containing histidine kinase [Lachnospiraceae bacterium]|nr:HAMP domain-containing histidine kinase [Lachnospiraceae bacterium]
MPDDQTSLIIILSILLGIAVIAALILAIRLILLHADIRKIRKELAKNREESYNRKLSVSLIDRDLEKMASEMNRDLAYQKELKLQAERTRKEMEQSASDIAHDLRTPLTVIRGNLQMIHAERLSGDEQECLQAAIRRTEELKVLVDEFYEISLLESGDVQIRKETMDLTEFLKEFILDHEVMIREKNLEPELMIPEKAILLEADKRILSRVMNNLMNNVYKYAEGTFFLSLTEAEGTGQQAQGAASRSVSICLANPLREENEVDLEHIFDRTYRADKARTSSGAGLGLYIVKLLVERSSGTITASVKDQKLTFEIIFGI